MTAGRILIVEDEFLLALEMRIILSDAGYRTLGPAKSVDQALALIESGDPQAAFVDCNLNGELATAVALTLKARRVPFAVVSGYAKEQLPPAFRGALFAAKPLGAARVLEYARELLSGGQDAGRPHR